MPIKQLAPLIAIIGSDGSGKSTVSEQLRNEIEAYGAVQTAHLGKQSGNIARSLAGLPLVGNWFGRMIARKVTKFEDSQTKNKTPNVFPSIVIFIFTLRRMWRFRRMLALRRHGFIIITDRYPQLDIPRAFDGPSLAANAEGNFLVRWLARREHEAFEWMTSYKPDLIIRLNVDLDTACARKPDHHRDLLRNKIEITPKLKFNGSPIVEIDSAQALDIVVEQAMTAVAAILTKHGYTSSKS